MDKTLKPCTRDDYEELLGFINKAFEKEEENWFIQHVGNIYETMDAMSDERIGYNYIMKDKGQIVASIGIYPMPMHCTLHEEVVHFTMAGIGSVAVDKAYRGKGIMTAMLQQVNQKMRDQGYPISWLGGDRFRYKNYGWDIAGMQHQMTVTRADLNKMDITKAAGVEATEKDIPVLQEIYKNYDNRQLRSEALWLSHLRRKGLITSIQGDSYLIHDVSRPEHLSELVGERDMLSLLYGHMIHYQLDSVTIDCPRDNSELVKNLMAISSRYHITSVGGPYGRVQILDADRMWSLMQSAVVKALDTYCNATYKHELLQQPKEELVKQCLDFVDYGNNAFMPKLPLWLSKIDSV